MGYGLGGITALSHLMLLARQFFLLANYEFRIPAMRLRAPLALPPAESALRASFDKS